MRKILNNIQKIFKAKKLQRYYAIQIDNEKLEELIKDFAKKEKDNKFEFFKFK